MINRKTKIANAKRPKTSLLTPLTPGVHNPKCPRRLGFRRPRRAFRRANPTGARRDCSPPSGRSPRRLDSAPNPYTPTKERVNVSSVDLEKSLRADVESYVAQRTSGLKEELERLRAQLNEALSRMTERLEEPAAEGDAPLAVAVSEHLRNARNLGIETAAAESTRARASSDIALIKAAVDELDA